MCVSFSGGKDSTVLLHLVRSIFPEVPAVYSDTGLEYPEVKEFVKRFANVVIVRPEESFVQVLTERGYPLISKEVAECCYYARKPYRLDDATPPRKRAELLGQRVLCRTVETAEEVLARPADGGQRTPGRTRYRRRLFLGKTRNSYTAGVTTGQAGDERSSCLTIIPEYKRSIFNKEKWLPLVRDTPFRISHECCAVMKKRPMKHYHRHEKRKPYVGMLAAESRMRRQGWIRTGCNAFNGSSPSSNPMAFWTEQDVLAYIKYHNLPIASVYGQILTVNKNGQVACDGTPGCKLKCSGCDRTGCVFCAFGLHSEKEKDGPTRFQRLAVTHPQLYDYAMRGGKWIDNPDYDPTYDGKPDTTGWVLWNPKKLWVPDKGLGLKSVFDEVNKIYGEKFYRYD